MIKLHLEVNLPPIAVDPVIPIYWNFPGNYGKMVAKISSDIIYLHLQKALDISFFGPIFLWLT